MRKGSRVLPTRLQAWRAHKFCRMAESILDPLIPSEYAFLKLLGLWGMSLNIVLSGEICLIKYATSVIYCCMNR